MNFRPGPDPDFPRLDENTRYAFPPPEEWDGRITAVDPCHPRHFWLHSGAVSNIIAIGGNLSPGMLLSAYEQGLFPWYNPAEDPLLWQSPDPRMVIFPQNLHISRSMRSIFEEVTFEITFNKDFDGVIAGCSQILRPGQGGTWINDDIITAYTEMHRLGWAVSAEAWKNGELAGGCYGLCLGKVFCGESMFARTSNASKAAFLSLAQKLFAEGVEFIDCQVPSNHLRSLGGTEITRPEFLKLLHGALSRPTTTC